MDKEATEEDRPVVRYWLASMRLLLAPPYPDLGDLFVARSRTGHLERGDKGRDRLECRFLCAVPVLCYS